MKQKKMQVNIHEGNREGEGVRGREFTSIEKGNHGQIRNQDSVNKSKRTYLFKGMCSKGPLVGIVPHKSLLETSLEIQER
jgi:hypothetical protein